MYVSDRESGRIYWVKEVAYAPQGAHVQVIEPRARQAPPQPTAPPEPSAIQQVEAKIKEAQYNGAMDRLRSEAAAAEAANARAAQAAQAKPKPQVYVPRVIDPYVR